MNTPFTGEVNVQDLHGRTVKFAAVEAKNLDIPCHQLAKGVYLVRLGSLPAKRIVRY